MSASIKLYYYPSSDPETPQRGEAERIRIFLKEVGYTFQDIAIDESTLQSMIDDQTVMCGQLPVLQVKGKDGWITYENASNIMATLAQKADDEHKGQGGNKFSGEVADTTKTMAIDQLVAEFEKVLDSRNGKNSGIDAEIKKYLSLLNGVLEANDGGDVRTDIFTQGTSFTYADISVFAVTNAVATIYGAEMVSETAGKLWEFHNNVAKRARIAMHLSKRADTN